jgi:hypothetical protein
MPWGSRRTSPTATWARSARNWNLSARRGGAGAGGRMTNLHKTLILGAIALGVLATLATFISALIRRVRLEEAGRDGLLRRVSNHAWAREVIRLVKVLLLAFGVLLSMHRGQMWGGWDVVAVRDVIVAVVALLMGVTSVWELKHLSRLENDLS